MKIDAHVHITPTDIAANPEKYFKNEPYFSLLSNSKVNKFASAEDAISMLESEGFDKAVVFGFGFRDSGLCRYVNDYTIEAVKKHPDKLAGFAAVPPDVDEAEKELERCFNSGLAGAGELFPDGQGFDLENERAMKQVTDICKTFGVPLLIHVNEPVGHYYAGKTDAGFKKIEIFVKNNPELKIILAHFGGGIFLYETMKEIKEAFINVYYDTAACPFIYDKRIYNVIKSLGICEKILFGSDFPILNPSRYFSAINESSLCNEEKKLITGLNAKKLLGI
ncbi:MAG: amidohydrolase family protein [Treponema sp.]|nr:amidohydrolase family protein [Treponema sp.]